MLLKNFDLDCPETVPVDTGRHRRWAGRDRSAGRESYFSRPAVQKKCVIGGLPWKHGARLWVRVHIRSRRRAGPNSSPTRQSRVHWQQARPPPPSAITELGAADRDRIRLSAESIQCDGVDDVDDGE